MVSALDDGDSDFALKEFRVLPNMSDNALLCNVGATDVFQDILGHHVSQFGGKLDTGRSTSADDE